MDTLICTLYNVPNEIVYEISTYLDKISLFYLSQVSRNLRWLLTDKIWIDRHIEPKYKEYAKVITTEDMPIWRIALCSVAEIRSYYTVKISKEIYDCLYRVADGKDGVICPGFFRKVKVGCVHNIKCTFIGNVYSFLYQGYVENITCSDDSIYNTCGNIRLWSNCAIYGDGRTEHKLTIYSRRRYSHEAGKILDKLEGMDLLYRNENCILGPHYYGIWDKNEYENSVKQLK